MHDLRGTQGETKGQLMYVSDLHVHEDALPLTGKRGTERRLLATNRTSTNMYADKSFASFFLDTFAPQTDTQNNLLVYTKYWQYT